MQVESKEDREVKARVIGGVELNLGRHLLVGQLNELRICSDLDSDAPLHGVVGSGTGAWRGAFLYFFSHTKE